MMRVLPWLLAALLALGCVSTIVYAVRQERERAAALSREDEAARIREENLKGVVLVEQKHARDVEAELAKAMKRIPELEAAVERARKASPGAKAVAVIQASTGPIEIPIAENIKCVGKWCTSTENNSTQDQVGPLTSLPRGDRTTPASPSVAGSPNQPSGQRPCSLFEGESIELRIDEALLETRAGNQLVAGAASVWHLDPEYRIAGGPFQAKVSTASGEREVSPRRAGWGVGPSVWGSSSGLAYGAILSPPPLDVGRLQVEVAAGLGFGSGGVQGSAAVLGRVR